MAKHTALLGVNLGGWLVVEKWITPQLFEGIEARNEYELVQTAKGKKRLERHHTTFITEQDFQWLKDHKIEILRLPVGHWIFGDKSPYIGAIDRLDWVFEMAVRYDLKILLDLHGAPGAQNASDHSGSGRPGLPAWLNSRDKQEATIQILERLARRYRDNSALWGIEIVNEPASDRFGLKLVWFYRRAYRRLTKVLRPGTWVVFSDGFKPRLVSGALFFHKRTFPIAMDCHLYHCFGEKNKRLSLEQHMKKTRQKRRLLARLRLGQPIIVGEWSLTLPFPTSEPHAQAFWDAQRQAYQKSEAIFYWNYKTGGTSRWNLRHLVETGQIVLK